MIYDLDGLGVNIAYNVQDAEIENAYDIDGTIVFSKTRPPVDYTSYIISDYMAVSLAHTQGFDICEGVLFQFNAGGSLAGDKMTTINTDTKAIIASNIDCVSAHGDSASFSRERYDRSDMYPLLYVTSDSNPALVYINRVTNTTSELVKTLSFPLEKTGYYAALAYDLDNEIIYMVGYTYDNVTSAMSGTNKTIISKWDATDMTDNGDETYTPAYISSVEAPFIYVQQGIQFHDGLIWIASGLAGSVEQHIYAVNPGTGNIEYTINTGIYTEIEGLAFISENEAIVGFQAGTYKKLTFGFAQDIVT